MWIFVFFSQQISKKFVVTLVVAVVDKNKTRRPLVHMQSLSTVIAVEIGSYTFLFGTSRSEVYAPPNKSAAGV